MKRLIFLMGGLIVAIVTSLSFQASPANAFVRAPYSDPALATYAQADSIMGDYFLDTAVFFQATGEHIDPVTVGAIPFTVAELVDARAKGEYLIYRGSNLSMQQLKEKYDKLHDHELLSASVENLKKEASYVSEKPTEGWYLVTDDVLPTSLGLNYLNQTERIMMHIADNGIFLSGKTGDGCQYEAEYCAAADAFTSNRSTIVSLILKGNGRKGVGDTLSLQAATSMLSSLSINAYCRESLVDVYYRAILAYVKSKKDILTENFIWTKSRSRSDQFMQIGGNKGNGLRVGEDYPNAKNVNCGTSFCHGKHFIRV